MIQMGFFLKLVTFHCYLPLSLKKFFFEQVIYLQSLKGTKVCTLQGHPPTIVSLPPNYSLQIQQRYQFLLYPIDTFVNT